MNKLFLFFIISVFVLLLLFSPGCINHTSSYELFEFAGDFQTRDINKAQMETPFPIITPDYIPKGLNSPPWFQGTLRRYQIDVTNGLTEGLSVYGSYSGAFSNNSAENTEVKINYQGRTNYLIILESRRFTSLGEPELNPGLKYVDILGTTAIFAEGARANLSFQRDGLSFLLESENIPSSNLISVAKSILTKELPNTAISNIETWPWGEAYGQYYTNDISIAQKETAFHIIIPTYIPEVFNQNSPNIEGPLASTQTKNTNTVKLLFFTAIVKESSTGTSNINGEPTQKSQDLLPVILEISEQSVPFPAQPDISPKTNITTIPGKDISIWTQDIGDMQCGGVSFKQGEIYINVSFYDLALDDVIKVVESLLT